MFHELEVSDLGNVRAAKTHRAKSDHVHGGGYLQVYISKGKKEYLHRLVARTFLPNADGLPLVNHKNGDKKNNMAANLEWCTYSHNHLHAYATGLRQPTCAKQVASYDQHGQRIAVYPTLQAAATAMGYVSYHSIARALVGKDRLTKGYTSRWGLEDDGSKSFET